MNAPCKKWHKKKAAAELLRLVLCAFMVGAMALEYAGFATVSLRVRGRTLVLFSICHVATNMR